MHPPGDSPAPIAADHKKIFAVIAGLLTIWGLALWLYNSLAFKFAKLFAFDPAAIAWTLFLFHAAYIAVVLPATRFHRSFGYKLGTLAGLSVFGVGAFLLYFALFADEPMFFFAAVALIGACGATLDTALNPLVAMTAAQKDVPQRIAYAHLFSATGLITGCAVAVYVLGKDYQLATGATAEISARPYALAGLAAILLAFLFEQIALPAFATKGAAKSGIATSSFAVQIRTVAYDAPFWLGAIAFASFMAVLTILWTALYRYNQIELPGHIVPVLERGWLWFFIGRVASVAAMPWITPLRQLAAGSAVLVVTILIAAVCGGWTGWIALIIASFVLAIAYPAILGAVLQRHYHRLAAAIALIMIAAGIGNALSSLIVSLALDSWLWTPRNVLWLALPFALAMLVFALRFKQDAKQGSRKSLAAYDIAETATGR